jgi:hypothetical protein
MANRSEYGRIRLYEDQSAYLRTLLKLERDRVTLQRRMHKADIPTHPFNRQIHFIDQMLGEVDRMRDEMGWASDWRSTDDSDELLLGANS